jgi:tetratricopeptide (TPR) repeat protein
VHELGQDESGLPFYVMKFVPGRTLKQVIEEFHASDPGDESSRKVGRHRLLKILVDLCNTVAFAHSRGVLHRDLTPNNVMVGNFGETVVLDWGLAKLMHQSDLPGGGSYVHSTYTDHSEETRAGSVLGAPPYMAPEMAEGHSNEVDQRTDICLLGSTLYHILTGEPPRSGKSYEDMIDMAKNVSPPPPRQVNRSIPRALEAICLKAMSRRRQDRYATAMALAEDVQNYLAGEPVTAYRESFPERAWRWARRHRQGLAWTSAALMMLALTTLAGVKIYATQQAARQAIVQAEEGTRQAIVKAEREEKEKLELEARQKAREDLAKFRDLADEVQYLAANRDAVDRRAPYYDLPKGKARANQALAIVDSWGPQLDQFALKKDPDLVAQVRREIYHLVILLAQATGGQADTVAAKEALDLLERARTWIDEPSPSYYRLRAESLRILRENDAAQEADRKAEGTGTRMTAHDYFLLGERYRRESAPEQGAPVRIGEPNANLDQAIEKYGQAIEQEPSHFWSHLQLGRCLIARGRSTESIAALSTAIGLRPESPWGYSTRGLVYAMASRFDDALHDLDLALQQRSDFRPALLNRGIVHWMQKQYDAAEADFARVLEPPDDQRLIEAAYYRTQLRLANQGKPNEVLADIKLVIDENRNFWPAYLIRARIHFSLSNSSSGLEDLNSFLAGEGDFDPNSPQAYAARGGWLRRLIAVWPLSVRQQEAIKAVALAQLDKAVELDVCTPDLYNDRGAIHSKNIRDLPPGEERLQLYRTAKAEYTKGIELDGEHSTLRLNRGWASIELGAYEEAFADFSEARRLVAGRLDPKNWSDVIALVEVHTGLGQAYANLGQANDAQREVARALTLLGDHDLSHYLLLHNVACIYGVLAKRDEQGRGENEQMALEFLRRAVTANRPNAKRMIKKDQHHFPQTMQEKILQL